MRPDRSRTSRGAATVLVTACLGVVLMVGCALAVVAAMFSAHRSAQAAADLAALAGATAAQRGAEPCTAAETTAVDNGARLQRCTVVGDDVTVEVEVPGPRWLGQPHDMSAAARAGPAAAARGDPASRT